MTPDKTAARTVRGAGAGRCGVSDQGTLFGPDWQARLEELLATAGTGPMHDHAINVWRDGRNVSYRVTAAVKSEVISLLREHAPERLVYPEEAA